MAGLTPMEVGLSLGSNLGDRLDNLREARRRIAALPGVRLLASSPVYETEPVGVKPEFRHLAFLNAVLIVEGAATPAEWRQATARVEMELGRVRSADKFAPRTMDIDILYVGGLCVDDGGLIIPHPRWMERRFVVQPLADVRPSLILPGAPGTVQDLLAALPDTSAVKLHAAVW